MIKLRFSTVFPADGNGFCKRLMQVRWGKCLLPFLFLSFLCDSLSIGFTVSVLHETGLIYCVFGYQRHLMAAEVWKKVERQRGSKKTYPQRSFSSSPQRFQGPTDSPCQHGVTCTSPEGWRLPSGPGGPLNGGPLTSQHM